MERGEVELFLERKCKVYTYNNFKFEGKILSVGETSLIIDDIKGMRSLQHSEVKDIKEVHRW